MRLLNGVLRPGEVLEVLEDGKIKVSAPGLFMEEDKDNNPPVMPFWEIIGSHANTFSTPVVGDEVWLLNLMDNPLQLYWFRKDKYAEANKDIFAEAGTENVEILCNRESGVGYATLYFSDGTGWILRNDDSRLQIFPDGHIEMGINVPKRTITIDSSAIHLGSGENEHSACYGEETAEILKKICSCLYATGAVAKSSPYTMALGTLLMNNISEIIPLIPGIKSTEIKIN